MTTQRESILAYIDTLLGTIEDAKTFRSREAAIDRTEGIALLLKPEDEQTELRANFNGAQVVRSLIVVITVISRGEIPDQVADPIIQAIHAALMADRTLGGRCALVVEQSTKWDFEVADQTALATEIRYLIRYATTASDISKMV